MTLTRKSLTLVSLAFAILAAPARADITPEQVRDVLMSRAKDAGLVVKVGTEKRTGPWLVLFAISVKGTRPDSSFAASLPNITLRDTGSGAVQVTMAPFLNLRGTSGPEAAPRSRVAGQITQTGFSALVSGTPENLTVDIGAAEIAADITTTQPDTSTTPDKVNAALTALDATIRLTGDTPQRASVALTAESLTALATAADGGAIGTAIADLAWTADSDVPVISSVGDFPGIAAKGSLSAETADVAVAPPADAPAGDTITDFTLRYTMTGFSTSGSVSAGPAAKDGPSPVADLDLSLSVASTTTSTDGDPTGQMRMSGENGPIRMSFAAHLPEGADDLDLSQALSAGLRMSARFDAAAGTSSADFAVPDLALSYSAATGPGRMEFALSSNGAVFDLSQTGLSLNLTSPEFPGPVSGSLKEIAFRLAFPVTPSEIAEPFIISQRITDLTLADAVWDLFDPGRTMTRRPMTLISDISGTARVLRDVFAEDAQDDLPVFPETLDITTLQLALGPADIAASGSLTFTGTPDAPKAEGRIKGTLKGLYALMNEIGATGLVPPEVFLGLRGGLAVVTKAVGPDDLVSDVEFRPDGTIWANGRKMALPQ